MNTFDPVKYKQATEQQWQDAAEAWHRWGPTLHSWLGPATDAMLGLGATRHGIIPDGAVLRLARVVGLGRAKELALLNDHITAPAALAMGLVNWVAPPADFDAALDRVVARCREAAPAATRHTKRLLHASFHVEPRGAIEDVVAAQMECMRSWELDEANRAWTEKREARFYPPPRPDGSRRGQPEGH